MAGWTDVLVVVGTVVAGGRVVVVGAKVVGVVAAVAVVDPAAAVAGWSVVVVVVVVVACEGRVGGAGEVEHPAIVAIARSAEAPAAAANGLVRRRLGDGGPWAGRAG